MSKSLDNCIYLSETADEIRKKVMNMYTDPDHIRVADPGKIEGNTVFTYLDAFCTDEHFKRYLPEYSNLDELKSHYQRGGLGGRAAGHVAGDAGGVVRHVQRALVLGLAVDAVLENFKNRRAAKDGVEETTSSGRRK